MVLRIVLGLLLLCVPQILGGDAKDGVLRQRVAASRDSAVKSTDEHRSRPDDAEGLTRFRVITSAGILVIYDAAIPPGEWHGPRLRGHVFAHTANPGFVAYWNNFATESLYVFDRLLFTPDDAAVAIGCLERDFVLDPGLFASEDLGVSRISSIPPATIDDGSWRPASRELVLSIMGFAADEEGVGGVAGTLWPCMIMAAGTVDPLPSPLRGVSPDSRLLPALASVGCPPPDGGFPPFCACCAPGCARCTSSDCDGDGISNGDDPDVDGDGILNGDDPDVDGDGTPNGSDPDIDGDGLGNGDDPDVDGDGLGNGDDPDVDGDGLGNGDDPDVNGDGEPNGSDSDVNGDGEPNGSDTDVNGDGEPNGSDTDVNGDGEPNGSDTDVNGDGEPNGSDTDVNGDGEPNGSDTDVNGDGEPNGSDTDVNGDGEPNGSDTDVNGDGEPNGSDTDVNGDGEPNGSDTDVDGDGIPNDDDLTPNGCEGACCEVNCAGCDQCDRAVCGGQ
jgi:hypothetical protein